MEEQKNKIVEIDDLTKSTALIEILASIDKYPTVEHWCTDTIIKPLIFPFFSQVVALILIESIILMQHNWIAALFGLAVIGYRISAFTTKISVSLGYGFLVLETRNAYLRGIDIGEHNIERNNLN
jgi:hypothetical protein